jgi:hypothetical protein
MNSEEAHRRSHLLSLGYDPSNPPDPSSLLSVLSLFTDSESFPIVGWGPSCLMSFRSLAEFENHNEDLWNNCTAFETLRNDRRVIELLESLDECDLPDEEPDE